MLEVGAAGDVAPAVQGEAVGDIGDAQPGRGVQDHLQRGDPVVVAGVAQIAVVGAERPRGPAEVVRGVADDLVPRSHPERGHAERGHPGLGQLVGRVAAEGEHRGVTRVADVRVGDGTGERLEAGISPEKLSFSTYAWAEKGAEEAVPALAELRDQGIVGAIGAGMNQSAMPARFLRETAADVVMVAGRYTLLDQSALDDVLPAALELGKSVVAAGVFNSGLLSRERPARDAKYDYRDAPTELVARAHAIAETCERHGTTLPAAAMAFPFSHPSVINVTVGMRDAGQVARNVELHGRSVPDALWDELRDRGLVRADVPAASGGVSRCL
ncbi:aldo/keto reductase [Streptomyces caniscabiei]|uniref:aldo/keto reductase n=1 Tax=Streptomyces caniscabiei TaxID=2746961 RepID=UPI003AF32B16